MRWGAEGGCNPQTAKSVASGSVVPKRHSAPEPSAVPRGSRFIADWAVRTRVLLRQFPGPKGKSATRPADRVRHPRVRESGTVRTGGSRVAHVVRKRPRTRPRPPSSPSPLRSPSGHTIAASTRSQSWRTTRPVSGRRTPAFEIASARRGNPLTVAPMLPPRRAMCLRRRLLPVIRAKVGKHWIARPRLMLSLSKQRCCTSTPTSSCTDSRTAPAMQRSRARRRDEWSSSTARARPSPSGCSEGQGLWQSPRTKNLPLAFESRVGSTVRPGRRSERSLWICGGG